MASTRLDCVLEKNSNVYISIYLCENKIQLILSLIFFPEEMTTTTATPAPGNTDIPAPGNTLICMVKVLKFYLAYI